MHYAPFDKLMALSNVEGLCAKRLPDSLTLVEDPDAFIGRTLIIDH